MKWVYSNSEWTDYVSLQKLTLFATFITGFIAHDSSVHIIQNKNVLIFIIFNQNVL